MKHILIVVNNLIKMTFASKAQTRIFLQKYIQTPPNTDIDCVFNQTIPATRRKFTLRRRTNTRFTENDQLLTSASQSLEKSGPKGEYLQVGLGVLVLPGKNGRNHS